MYKEFWRIKAQPSVQLIAWRVLEDKITSKQNLVKRRISMESSVCNMCEEVKETTSHLLCTCRVSCLVWPKCYKWVGLISLAHQEPKMHCSSI